MADIIKKVNALGLLDQYTIAKSLGQEDEFCKSFGIDIEKGGKAAAIGEIREFGGKKYQKGQNGWRPVKKGDQKSEVTEEAKKELESKGIKEAYLKLLHEAHDFDSKGKHDQASLSFKAAQAMKKEYVHVFEDQSAQKEKNDTNKREKVSRENHEALLKLVGDIDANNVKSKRLNPSAIDKVWENLKSENPDYQQALNLIQDYSVNDRGKTIKTEEINSINDKVQAELDKRGNEPQLSENSKVKVLKVVAYLRKHRLTTTTNEINSAADGSDEILSPKEIDAVRFYFDKESVKPSSQPTHIGDMSKEQKFAAAAKFGIENPEKLSTKELDKQLTDKNIEAELKKFKESKNSNNSGGFGGGDTGAEDDGSGRAQDEEYKRFQNKKNNSK